MSALLWWLIPLGATLAALGWAAWRSRPARQIDMHASMSDQERFRQAMARPLPGGSPARSERPSRSARGRSERTNASRRAKSASASKPRDAGHAGEPKPSSIGEDRRSASSGERSA